MRPILSQITALCTLVAVLFCSASLSAQQIHYTGSTLSNPYLLDGGLTPVVGTHCIQTMRAMRSDTTVCRGWTYNHQPMLAYWQGRFWMHFLSDPVGEHIPSSVTWLQTSADGYEWTQPTLLFPDYELPAEVLSRKKNLLNADGSLHKVSDTLTYPNMYERTHLKAIMHQRVGWHVSSPETGSRLLAIGNYGICLHRKDDPNDGNGIGRVVRELFPDGSMGPIYFFYYNHGWNASNTNYPFYTKSKDKKFKKAVEEILNSPLYWMQFVEECDREDSHLPLTNGYKAFNYYTLPDGETIVSLWKHALTSHSNDGGRTWRFSDGSSFDADYQARLVAQEEAAAQRAPGFVNSNAKIWGQRLTDGSFATIYNPSEFRWPLALSTSADGLDYTTLNLLHGDITQMRYGGNYKSNGPQYARGILPGNGSPADQDLWVSYSVNKEDMWVTHVPVPVRLKPTTHASADEFDDATSLADLREWNLYCPLLAPLQLQRPSAPSAASGGSANALMLIDRDPFDYARADRLIPATRHLQASFDLMANQNDHGELQLEVCDAQGNPCTRLWWQPDGQLTLKTGARYTTILKQYAAGTEYHILLDVNLDTRMVEVSVTASTIGGSSSPETFRKRAILYAPIAEIERLTFRTGGRRTDLTPDTKADRAEYEDLPDPDHLDPVASFSLSRLITSDATAHSSLLIPHSSLQNYVAHFNAMEDENISQLIPNAQSADWMQREIPLFECPDPMFEEMYYYRWWTLRKHLIQTPTGYAQTEFLVKRSYADQHNLIACAVSHHIMEARWLHNPQYALDEPRVWLRGNDGQPMAKLHKFSSLIPFAMLQQAKVLGNIEALRDLHDDLVRDQQWWDDNQLWSDSLYWQGDVQDGMEESISGGRYSPNKRKFHQNRRPTINSYMYGNLMALAHLPTSTQPYPSLPSTEGSLPHPSHPLLLRAQALQQRTLATLWSDSLQFFCARDKEDSLHLVRELIGYLPWYTGLAPDDARYATPWLQLADPDGFLAPYGMTTAERRHPQFRQAWKGRPTCEWDGAIWPFATSQTLTALANVMNDYPQTAALLPDTLFFEHLRLYTESMHRRGRPYIGEYLDEQNGAWLWGDAERSRYYNHSTYCDLIITGLVGLRPSLSNEVTIHPLLPAGTWPWFCLDGIAYHGHTLTIVWDADGSRYHQGRGLSLLIDGHLAANSPTLSSLHATIE